MSAKLPFLPPARPRLSREKVEAMARKAGVSASVYLVGVRGYYHDDHEENDRGIYDDAMFLVSPQNFVSFNANVDPSVARKGIAKLKAGVWLYKLGIHGLTRPKPQRYRALVQAAVVTVIRDGQGPDTGMFGINIGCFVIFQAQDFETFFGIELNESNDANFEVTGVHRKQILQNIYVFPPLKDDVARFDVIRIGDKNLIEKLSQNKFRENSIAAEHGMFVVISKNE